MNTSIIKGTMRTGLGKVIRKWASLTGNKTLYLKGTAAEWTGKGQRSYGRLKDASRSASKMLMRKAKKVPAPVTALGIGALAIGVGLMTQTDRLEKLYKAI